MSSIKVIFLFSYILAFLSCFRWVYDDVVECSAVVHIKKEVANYDVYKTG